MEIKFQKFLFSITNVTKVVTFSPLVLGCSLLILQKSIYVLTSTFGFPLFSFEFSIIYFQNT